LCKNVNTTNRNTEVLLYTRKEVGLLPHTENEYETWSLTSSEEHGLRMFENRVLRKIFELKREEVAGGWRRLHNEDLHNLYPSPNVIRMMKEDEACSSHGRDGT
jgi:hypothetical protein